MFQGVQELVDYRKNGKVLSRKEAMTAFCADCMNEYADGRAECKNPRCPMYQYMPYRKEKVIIETSE